MWRCSGLVLCGKGRETNLNKKEKKTYQSLLAVSLVPDPYRIHPQRHLLPLGADAEDLLPQRQLLLLRRAHSLAQGV